MDRKDMLTLFGLMVNVNREDFVLHTKPEDLLFELLHFAFDSSYDLAERARSPQVSVWVEEATLEMLQGGAKGSYNADRIYDLLRSLEKNGVNDQVRKTMNNLRIKTGMDYDSCEVEPTIEDDEVSDALDAISKAFSGCAGVYKPTSCMYRFPVFADGRYFDAEASVVRFGTTISLETCLPSANPIEEIEEDHLEGFNEIQADHGVHSRPEIVRASITIPHGQSLEPRLLYAIIENTAKKINRRIEGKRG